MSRKTAISAALAFLTASARSVPEHGHQREDVVQILAGNFGDVATAARAQLNQPLGRKHFERFAQRGPRDAILFGEFLSSIQVPGVSSCAKMR